MTREIKDGFVVNDRRYWVDDEEDEVEPAAAEPAPGAGAPPAETSPAVDVEALRNALADLEETKHRLRRDAEKQRELQRAQVLESLLPVLDNLERSIAAGETTASVGAVVDGVKLVHQQFLAALRDFGLERRSAVGEKFDPRIHDAVAVIPVADPQKDGVVVAELEPGYHVGDRVVRPARVQVGRAAERPSS
jgi:molecular chaperone GrpE (heat shock protein)